MPDPEKILATHTGMKVDSFQTREGLGRKKQKIPAGSVHYTDLVYQPIIEVLKYLRDKMFKRYIATSGGHDFVRRYSERVYGEAGDGLPVK
jgi:hypothetical protein